ncbi:MAG: DNA recombination protein RmuC, partial [Sphingomonadales bacterium]|nr:DNA recombination protein RmuC [Sphingomonadales bacterium]
MDPAILSIIALLAGAALGWFIASRPLADLRARLDEAERAGSERAGEFKRAIAELGEARVEVAALGERAARADGLAQQLDAAREENARFRAERAAFEEQKRLLEESRANLLKEFENTGAQVLNRAQEAFLKRAEERLGHSEKASEEKLKALLSPVGEKLANYERQVADLEAKRTDAFGQLAGLIQSMKEGQEQVR